MDDGGIVGDDARESLEAGNIRPSLAYSVPTFQNPSGVTMSLARRAALLELSERFGMPLIEDAPYEALRYDGAAVPGFRALPGGQDAIYLGTFSKTLAPGLRIGYVVAPRPLI